MTELVENDSEHYFSIFVSTDGSVTFMNEDGPIARYDNSSTSAFMFTVQSTGKITGDEFEGGHEIEVLDDE